MLDGYSHGWQSCRRCHADGAVLTTQDKWRLRANPGYWGDANPTALVLGFSKGANQERAVSAGAFDGVAFANARSRLRRILEVLNVDLDGQTIDEVLTSRGRGIAAASLVRCGFSMEKDGKLVTSGTVMTDAVREPWTREVMQRCIRAHLVDMPGSVRTVVLLGNDDRYVAGVKSLIRGTFADFTEVNEVAFNANGRVWVFAAHPAPGNGHLLTWLNGSAASPQGHKRILAKAALGLCEASPDTSSSTSTLQYGKPDGGADMTMSSQHHRTDRFGRSFYLEHESGARLFPVRMRNRDTGELTFRVSRAGNTKAAGREVRDEHEVYRLVASGEYAVRAASLTPGSPVNLLKVGVRSIRRIVKV